MKILVVVGAMARGTVRDPAASYSRHVDELVVADTFGGRAEALVREIGEARLKSIELDVPFLGSLSGHQGRACGQRWGRRQE